MKHFSPLLAATLASMLLVACSGEQSASQDNPAAPHASALHPIPPQLPEPVRVEAPTAREALLEQRLRALEARLAAVPQAASAASARPAPIDRAGPPAVDTRQQDHERLTSLDAGFRQEAAQSAWAVTQASVLRQTLSSEAPGAVRSVECRGRTCRLDLADGDASVRQLMSQLLQRLPDAFGSAQVAHRADGSAVLYLQP